MNIGIITYKKYEERVFLNEHFKTNDLFRVICDDPDYVTFQIVDESETLLLSTHFPETGENVAFLKIVQVKREVEILGKTYNAYYTPQLTYKTKVSWKVDGGICQSKKEAHDYARHINAKAKLLIEKCVQLNNSSHTKR
ncbi:hypothetical protein [Pedobacter agri]|uniref:hypothetical protein n=1 Tax=Pedobacter agri TaxID=454586 RepID=UPI00292E18D9|nr:hypothetical protein [Pedobacter agri]